ADGGEPHGVCVRRPRGDVRYRDGGECDGGCADEGGGGETGRDLVGAEPERGVLAGVVAVVDAEEEGHGEAEGGDGAAEENGGGGELLVAVGFCAGGAGGAGEDDGGDDRGGGECGESEQEPCE